MEHFEIKHKYYEDDIWKDIIEKMFKEFVSFFMPELFENIDFEKGFSFLEQELNKLFPESEEKRRRTDKLAKVFLKNGEEKWLLFHIEIQGYEDKEFEQRMFSYYYRIYDKYKKEITALVIFTENKENYKPNKFEKESYGTKIIYQYNTYKILEQSEEELKSSKNIFSLAILTSLLYLKSKNDEDKKYNFKIDLTKLLFEKNYSIDKIRGLFKFINLLFKLSDELKEELYFEEVKKMALKEQKLELISGYDEVLLKNKEKEIAKKAKKEGLSIEMIIKLTGLTKKEIESL